MIDISFCPFFSTAMTRHDPFSGPPPTREGGVGAVAALGTAAGRGKSGPRSSALQRTSEVRLGSPCRGAAQRRQKRGDFAEQRSQGELGFWWALSFSGMILGWFSRMILGCGVGGDFFWLNFIEVLQTGPPAANFQVPPAPPTTTIPTIPVAAASPRRDQSPSPKKPKSRQWQWNDSRISVGVHPKGCPNYEDFKKNPPNKSDFHRKSRDLV